MDFLQYILPCQQIIPVFTTTLCCTWLCYFLILSPSHHPFWNLYYPFHLIFPFLPLSYHLDTQLLRRLMTIPPLHSIIFCRDVYENYEEPLSFIHDTSIFHLLSLAGPWKSLMSYSILSSFTLYYLILRTGSVLQSLCAFFCFLYLFCMHLLSVLLHTLCGQDLISLYG